MANDRAGHNSDLSRREFLAATGGAVAGAAAFGAVGQAEAAGKRHPKRGGTLRFSTRADVVGLDPHRHTVYLVSHPLAATTQGLVDLDLNSEPAPGIAEEWTASNDLLTYTFKIRKGALFHNNREIDAEAVKWNLERMLDPKKSHPFVRSALANLTEAVAVDKYTLRCLLKAPSAVFPSEVIYYPCALIAPDSEDRVDTLPIGCGPFKFVKWERDTLTVMERFENYYETDAEGNSLPYLDAIEGRPKKADRVRLTALRSGEVDLIDNMAYADAAEFPKKYGTQYQTWDVPSLGTSFVTFNTEKGPFADKRLRQAAAHAIDHEAIKQAVFYGRGETSTGYYASVSPWYAKGSRPWPEYDPDKAKFLIKQAKAEGTEIALMSRDAFPYQSQTGELVQAMWTEVGFKVQYNIYDEAVLRQKKTEGDFHADSSAGSYRFDPDGFYGRQILSTGPSTKNESRFKNEKVDKLILEARATANKAKRLEIYAEVNSLVNEELPMLYIHHLTLLQAGAKNLMDYKPAFSGPFSTRGAGIRTAWMA